MTEPQSSQHPCPQQAGEAQLVHYRLDRSALTYLYDQIVDHLAERIASGDLAANAMLPAEIQLARQYGVSLGTARRAIETLRERGLVVTLPCKGTYVVARPSAKADASGNAAAEASEPGWLALIQDGGS